MDVNHNTPVKSALLVKIRVSARRRPTISCRISLRSAWRATKLGRDGSTSHDLAGIRLCGSLRLLCRYRSPERHGPVEGVDVDVERWDVAVGEEPHLGVGGDRHVLGGRAHAPRGLRLRRLVPPDLVVGEPVRALDLTLDLADARHAARDLDPAQVIRHRLRLAAEQYGAVVHRLHGDVAVLPEVL